MRAFIFRAVLMGTAQTGSTYTLTREGLNRGFQCVLLCARQTLIIVLVASGYGT